MAIVFGLSISAMHVRLTASPDVKLQLSLNQQYQLWCYLLALNCKRLCLLSS